jgi:hypothetical protein
MHTQEEALKIVKNKLEMGEITTEQANVLLVQLQGYVLITGKMRREVRKALNDAVKRGELGHLKREGLKPEAYFHKNGKWNAMEARARYEFESIEALKKILG